jgi:predicted ribosome-associated RNA-binding protein Tma20
MRKLYPTGKDSIRELNQVNQNFKFDEETYRQLLAQIEELRQELAADKIDLEEFKHNLEQAVNTITVTSENVRTNILNATTAVLANLTATQLTAPDADITRLIADAITGDTAAIRALTATDATLTNATISDLNATEATIGELHTTTFNPASVSTTDLTATNATVTNETVTESTINKANIAEADIDKAEVVELKADEADILEAEINQIYSEKLNVKYVTHKEQYNRQEVTTSSTSADGDYWIVLPKFLNGTFNILAKSDTNNILWSMEIMNSTRNIAFRWSVNDDYNFLKDVDLVLDEESCQEFIQIHANTNGLGTFLYYRADSFDTEVTPTIWAIKKYDTTDPLKHFDFNRAAGTWLPNSVFAGEFHADSMIIDETVFERITLNHDLNLPTAYDQYGNPINYTTGTPGQYITPVLDEYDHTGIQWKDPIDNRTPTDAQETIDLITQATLGNYTGKMVAERVSESITEYADILTDATQSIKVVDNFYPITDKQQLPAYRDEYIIKDYSQEDIDELVASGLYLKDDSTDPATYTQISAIDVENKTIDGVDYSADWDTLKAYSDEHAGYDQIKYNGGWHTVTYPFDVWVSNGEEYNIVHTGDGTEVHGDATIDNDLDVKRDVHIERDADIDRDLNVNRDVEIGGDLTVATSYTDPDTSVTKLNKVRLPNIYNGENAPTMPDGSLVIELNRTSGTHTETREYIRANDDWYTYPGVVPTEASTGTFDHSYTFDWPVVIIPYDNVYHNVVSEHKWYDINGNEVSDQDKIDELDASPRTNFASRAWYKEEIPTAVSTILERVKDVSAGGVVTKRRDEIAAYKSDSDKLVAAKDGQPMVWRDDTRTIEPADELTLDNLEVDDLKVNHDAEVVNDLKVGSDVMIGGDLHVAGKAYIDDVIEQQTEGNFITLRANNQNAMTPQELSGMLINNTDGQGNIVAIVTDKDGVARVGDVTGTRTTYNELYLVVSTGKYYTDDTYTTEVSPTGTLIKWDTYEKIEDETLGTIEAWTNAIFVTISSLNPDLEPLATRKESVDMNDQGLVKWNDNGAKLDTLPLPTINGQKLVAKITPDPLDPSAAPSIEYEWGGTDTPSTFRFPTVEAYNAALLIPEGQVGYIPDGSIILIDGNYNMEIGV